MTPLQTLVIAITSMFLVGCASAPKDVDLDGPKKVSWLNPKEIFLWNPFDVDAAQKLLQKGNNTIKGGALIRQRGGGVVTCAGTLVGLLPATEYATERNQAFFGLWAQGYLERGYLSRDSRLGNPIKFVPDHSEYHRLVKTTTCDAQGNFVFSDISDGVFYVVAEITWRVGSSTEGGNLIQFVAVSGGETKEIILSP